jgi:hypothetical protein
MNIKNFIFFIVFNILKPALVPIFRHFNFFDFAILVYPGTKNDIEAYLPFKFIKKIIPTISIIGFIRNKKGGKRGIIIATKYSIEEIKGKESKIVDLSKKFAEKLDIKKIALVGRLPKILFNKDQNLFVEGKFGTVFTVINSIETVMSRLSFNYDKINIGVIGVGFIGKEVLMNLKSMGFKSIVGFDTRFEKDLELENGIKKIKNPVLLKDCDVVVILTPNGDDVEELIPYFKSGIIVLDDTHPFLSQKNIERICGEKSGVVYKVAVTLNGAVVFPKMPGFKTNWIPGCVVETIVYSYKNLKWKNQSQFNEIAEEVGFQSVFCEINSENKILD